jgi:hypothetical protein
MKEPIAVLSPNIRTYWEFLRNEGLNRKTQTDYRLVRNTNDIEGYYFSAILKLHDWYKLDNVHLLIAILEDRIKLAKKLRR